MSQRLLSAQVLWCQNVATYHPKGPGSCLSKFQNMKPLNRKNKSTCYHGVPLINPNRELKYTTGNLHQIDNDKAAAQRYTYLKNNTQHAERPLFPIYFRIEKKLIPTKNFYFKQNWCDLSLCSWHRKKLCYFFYFCHMKKIEEISFDTVWVVEWFGKTTSQIYLCIVFVLFTCSLLYTLSVKVSLKR